MSFRDLQNYTTLKLRSKLFFNRISFRDLQNYTTLKQSIWIHNEYASFRDLQNYTTLKQYTTFTDWEKVLEIYRITLLSNLNQVVLARIGVLEIYRITLLSNYHLRLMAEW